MKTYNVTKSRAKTLDGLYIYNLRTIPQEQNYIKVSCLFAKEDNKIISQVASILKTTDFKINFVTDNNPREGGTK